MSQIGAYDALWQSQRTRRRPVPSLVGLDAVAGRWYVRARNAKLNTAHWRKLAEQVDALDAQFSAMNEADLGRKIAEVHELFRRHRDKPEHLIQAMAIVRELACRKLGQKPYIVQLMGALAICHGQVVEMATGEGKTLTAAVAATVLGWGRPNVHVVTANEYLAARDAQWMATLMNAAGLTVGAIVPSVPQHQRGAIYRKNVVYTTQKDLVGDWLRDHLALGHIGDAVTLRLAPPKNSKSAQVLVPGLHAVIVDEADAVLIDNAVTPLIIATARGKSGMESVYRRAAELATKMALDVDYEIQVRYKRCKLHDEGKLKVLSLLTDADRGPWLAPRRRHELIEQALTAIHCYKRGEQYDMVEGRVTMIDEFTGRFQPDRHWQHGMHQAVQAKEGLEVEGEGHSLASLSFQRFFRMYPLLAGMTGTAVDAKSEFEQTYRVPVRLIPTHRPVQRKAWPMRVFVTSEQRWQAVADSVAQLHALGRPVLVGTRSVAASQHLSELLKHRGLNHQVLNAIHHEIEAQIISQAGQRGAITVATNMAGRGTDILLGPGVVELGGLHVILTERHDSSRIDRQLIGRAARQGDPGSSQVLVSLEDVLVQKHSAKLAGWLMRVGQGKIDEQGEIHLRGIEAVFRWAQNRAQLEAFRARKTLLQRDDWVQQAMPG